VQWDRRILGSLIERRCFRGDAHPLVTGFRNPDFCGFKTLAEAEAYMEDHGVEDYKYEIKQGAGETTPEKNQTAYYAVANGRTPGIREYY